MATGEVSPDPSGRPHIRLSTSSGSIAITAEDRADVEVSAGGKVWHRPSSAEDPIGVRGSKSVDVRCPTGTDVVVGSSSGSMRLHGPFGDVRATSHSGSMTIDEVASADLRTTSGSVEVQHCEGSCRITTTSGSVRIDGAGDADVSGGSGTVRVTGVTARVRTVSGTVKLVAGGDVSVETVSGTIAITVPPHLHPRVVSRGLKRPKIDVEEGDDSVVSVRSLSGSITVRSR